MDINLPLVSFVIPTHNRADILRECLESVVNQTYKNIEVIVVNDNSSDNTEDILFEYKNRYDFFKYYNSEEKGGNAARNLGIKMAKGEYIAFMDDDDICELFRIEEQMKPILESNFKYDFVISSLYMFDSKGKKREVIDYLKPLDSIGLTVRWLVKKDNVIKSGGFDIEQPALQEVEFFWRLKNHSNIYFSKVNVVKVRNSPISVTKSYDNMINGIKRLVDLHGKEMKKFELNVWITTLCKNYAYKNDWDNFRKSFYRLNKRKFPFTTIFLFLTLISKKRFFLKLHSKLQNLIFSLWGYYKLKSNKNTFIF